MAAAPDQHIGLGHWEPAINRKDMRRALEAAAPHLAAAERPVFVVAVGHDLDAQDAERIQRAVVQALRRGGEGGGT